MTRPDSVASPVFRTPRANLAISGWQLLQSREGLFCAPYIGRRWDRDICHPSFVDATLKRLGRAAGYPPEESSQTSGDSLRVSAAQTLTVMGFGCHMAVWPIAVQSVENLGPSEARCASVLIGKLHASRLERPIYPDIGIIEPYAPIMLG